MTEFTPIPVTAKPGVKRDGTRFEGEFYTDAEWCRFDRGLPRKINGFLRLTDLLPGIARGMHLDEQDNLSYIHAGSEADLSVFTVNPAGAVGVVNDRTPSGLASNSDYLWQMDAIYDENTLVGSIISHPGVNLADPLSTTNSDVYIGDLTTTTALTAIASSGVSGGVVVLHPYLFVFGNNGFVNWSVANDPSDLTGSGSGEAFIAEDKILKGMVVRGGPGNSPAGLFWSVSSLIRCTFIGGTLIFDFDTFSHNISVMSAPSIIEYDGVYFWPGVDRFYMFDGVVRELPNDLDKNWFFDGINFNARGKCFGFSVPRWGEIWWCYPRGTATECTHAVIYNLRMNTWYDTQLPNTGRSSACYSQYHRSPILGGVVQQPTLGYNVWRHETSGYDEVRGGQSVAIRSSFKTNALSAVNSNKNSALTAGQLEIDFEQTGNMTVQLKGGPNARRMNQTSDLKTFSATDETVGFKKTMRLMELEFVSNVAGGFYQMGKSMLHIKPSDKRVRS
jgi:hypothetical protein